MKIWIDDLRSMPEEFDKHIKTVDEAIAFIFQCANRGEKIELISLDHDAGDEYKHGGDYIKILEYLEYLYCVHGVEVCTKFRIHTGNPVGAEKMRAVLKACNWEEFRFDWEDLW